MLWSKSPGVHSRGMYLTDTHGVQQRSCAGYTITRMDCTCPPRASDDVTIHAGVIPQELSNLKDMEDFHVTRNRLTGEQTLSEY